MLLTTMPTPLSLRLALNALCPRDHSHPEALISRILQMRSKTEKSQPLLTATHLTHRAPEALPAAAQGPRVTHVAPLSLLPGEAPFPDPFSAPLRPPPPVRDVPQAPGPRRPRPAVPASAAAATAPLTPIAEQDARRSQGRSHVCAD